MATNNAVNNDLSGATGTGAFVGSDSPVLTTQADVDNLRLSGNTIISTDTDGDINISPNGDGKTNLNKTFMDFTATENDSFALEIDCDTANFSDVKAIDIFYDAGTMGATIDEGVAVINIDESASTGGEVFAFQILSTAEGSASVHGTFHGVNVAPLTQLSGTFGDADSLLDNAVDVTVALSGGGAGNVSVFEADNETFTIGDAATFEEVEFIVDTGASGGGIGPTWEYSIAGPGWATFSPVDGTNGFRNTGEAVWITADLAGWVTDGGEYLIRITRTRNSLSTTPILDLVQIVAPTEYTWNKDGVVSIKDLLVADDIQHTGDSNNKIAFGTDTQSLETGGTSRIDISDSGVRLGAANSRVTTILDEDTLSSDSDTSLATQQSIKAYVDASGGGSVTQTQTLSPFIVNRYYFPYLSIANAGNIATVTDKMNFVKFYLPDGTYTRLGVQISSGGGAGANVKIGLYDCGTDGLPETLVVDGGELDASGTAAVEATISYTAPAGWYFIALLDELGFSYDSRTTSRQSGQAWGSLGVSTNQEACQMYDTQTYATGLPATYSGTPTYVALGDVVECWVRIV